MESPCQQIPGIAIHSLSQRIVFQYQGCALPGFFLEVDETLFRTQRISYRVCPEETAVALATLVSEEEAHQDHLRL